MATDQTEEFMQVRMLKLMAGPDGVAEVGSIATLPVEQAREMIAAGAATADLEPAATITARRAKRRWQP